MALLLLASPWRQSAAFSPLIRYAWLACVQLAAADNDDDDAGAAVAAWRREEME